MYIYRVVSHNKEGILIHKCFLYIKIGTLPSNCLPMF